MAKKKDTQQTPSTERKSSTARTRPGLYIFSVIILVIIVVTFVGAPVVSGSVAQGALIFGRYGNREIAYAPGSYLARQYQAIASQYEQRGDSTTLEAELRMIWRQAFNQTLLHAAVMREAEASDMNVSESRVDEMLAQDPRFQVDGVFSAELYRRTPSQERFSLRNYYRESLIHQNYLDDVLNGPRFSGNEIDFIKSMGSPERRFEGAALTFSDFPDSEVAAYGRQNGNIFRRVNLSVITLRDEGEAQRIRRQWDERTASFEELARAHSVDRFSEQGGDAGWVYVYQLNRDFEDPDTVEEIVTLETGGVSAVLEAINGWVIYRLDDGPLDLDLDSDEGLSIVRSYMEAFERGVIEDYLLAELEALVEESQDAEFASVVEASAAEGFTTDYFPVNYGNLPYFPQVASPETDLLEGAAFRQTFLEGAFSLDEGDVSEPVVLGDSVVALRLVDEREAPEGSLSFMDSFYEFLVQQFHSEDVQSTIIDPDLVEDNFSEAFNRFVLGN